MLALFELHGLRRVNETYGHATGDALLARLGRGLERTLSTHGTAYRLGGDEFGALWLAHVDGASLALAAAALSETGDLGRVDCSFVSASIPAEAATPDGAFGLVTSRMHAWKTLHRNGASRQSRDVLVRVLAERSPDLDTHSDGVSELAEATARKLGLQDDDVRLIRLAAELHDVGKSALPDSILNKPGPLDATEWEFMRRHTLIGERIVAAAAALTPVAHLVRSSHERLDGGGYPDGLAGDEIPLGARILAVCDAYDAMVSDRSYRRGMPMHEAVAELRRCAGSQFDPRVVDAFCSLTLSPGAETRAA